MSKDNLKAVPEVLKFEIVTGEYKNDKVKFNVYKAFIGTKKKGYTLKFRKDVKNLPQESGFLTCRPQDMSIDKSGKYPVLWIHAYETFTPHENDNVEKIIEFFSAVEDKE